MSKITGIHAISPSEVAKHSVEGNLPDKPSQRGLYGNPALSAQEVKAAYDKLPKRIVEYYNALAEAVSVGEGIMTGIREGHTLKELLADITSGDLAAYLSLGGETLTQFYENQLLRNTQIGDALPDETLQGTKGSIYYRRDGETLACYVCVSDKDGKYEWKRYGLADASEFEAGLMTSEEKKQLAELWENKPDLPEFDLTEMGLSEIVVDGDVVTLTADTAEIRSALEKGMVRVHFKFVENGRNHNTSTVILPAEAKNTYVSVSTVYSDDLCWVTFYIDENVIQAYAVSAAHMVRRKSPFPIPDTADEGRVLTVENGTAVWTEYANSEGGSSETIPYVTCTTLGNVVNKAVTIPDFTLTNGSKIVVKFEHTHTLVDANLREGPNATTGVIPDIYTRQSPKLQVNGGTAYPIYYNGKCVPPGHPVSGKLYELVFDGTVFHVVGSLSHELVFESLKGTRDYVDVFAVGSTSINDTDKYNATFLFTDIFNFARQSRGIFFVEIAIYNKIPKINVVPISIPSDTNMGNELQNDDTLSVLPRFGYFIDGNEVKFCVRRKPWAGDTHIQVLDNDRFEIKHEVHLFSDIESGFNRVLLENLTPIPLAAQAMTVGTSLGTLYSGPSDKPVYFNMGIPYTCSDPLNCSIKGNATTATRATIADQATFATNDSKEQEIASTYVKSLDINTETGVISYTTGDNKSHATVLSYVLVPRPASKDEGKILRVVNGVPTWTDPEIGVEASV